VEQKPTSKILNGILQNDRKCQELLYKQFYSYGMSISLRYTNNRDEAVEVLNDGFMKVFSHISHYDSGRNFTAWFRKILINTAINYHKKNIKHNHLGLDKLPDVPALQQSALEELGYHEMILLIQELQLAYRTVFNLYVIEGYTHEEIGTMLTISVGTSKSNLSRARAHLRSKLTQNQQEGATRHER
jgi:RNA polymerase sigma factor (sigma-70 family)